MNAYDNAMRQLEKASQLINLDKDVLAKLSAPERVIMASLPVKMDDGRIEVIEAYRVQHSQHKSP